MSTISPANEHDPLPPVERVETDHAPPSAEVRSPDLTDPPSPASLNTASQDDSDDDDDERASLKPSLARSTHSYGSTIDPDSACATVPYRRRRARQAGPSRLRSRLLCGLVTVLLGICIYGSFVDDFMGTVEDGISCGFCLGLLMPLQALAHLGDDAFVDMFVGFCAKLGVSTFSSNHSSHPM